jgi:hypothetical protein
MPLPRLRQVVLAAHDLDATTAQIETVLGVREPFRDPGVGHFGLANAVFAVGDTFLEVVSPTSPGTAAGRYLERRGGDSGYMVMFELDDEPAVRKVLDVLDIRVVHDMTYDDIVDLHLHPKDVPGAIVALHVTNPLGSWRWGGPAWEGRIPQHEPGGIVGLTVAAVDAQAVATKWAAALCVDVTTDADGYVLALPSGQRIDVIGADDVSGEGIVACTVDAALETPTTISGVRFSPGQLVEAT